MRNKPLLSVIIPIYNGKLYLMETMESIRKSTYSNLEILLIDDGSIDGSCNICKKIAKSDRRIRYIRKENQGITATRNLGLQMALGEFICFCDQDDVVAVDCYKEMMQQLILTRSDMAICSTAKLIGNHKVHYETVIDGIYSELEVRKNLLFPLLFRGYDYPFVGKENNLYGTIWKCIFRKSFLVDNKMEFYFFVNYEDDWLFFLRALLHAKSVVTLSKIGYYWRCNLSSESHTKKYIADLLPRLEALDSCVVVLLKEGGVPENIVREFRKIQICQHFQELFDNYASLGIRGCVEKTHIWLQIMGYMEEKDYVGKLTCLNRLQRCANRRRILYTLLYRRRIKLAFLCNYMSLRLQELANSSFFIAKMDKWMKDIVRRREYEK